MQNYWNGIYGQEPVKQVLTRLIDSSKIPHAFLFTGNDGIGKDYIALRFSQALNSKLLDHEKAETINNFIQNFSEPYIKYIFPLPRGKNENDSSGPTEKLSPDEIQLLQEELRKKSENPYYRIVIPKANNIKINSIRDIKKFLAFEYSDIPYRVVLISDAHLMNEESQNALLKSLEEPPEGVIFILTTSFPTRLRETIRSRCRVINFQPLEGDQLKNILSSNFNVEPKLAEKVSTFAAGSVTNALKLIESDIEGLLEKTIFILRYSFGRKFNSALDQFGKILTDNDSETVKVIINLIIIWLNDIQRHKFEVNELYFRDYIDTLEKFNKKFYDVRSNEIIYKLEVLSSVIQNNVNLNLIVLNVVHELAALTTLNTNS